MEELTRGVIEGGGQGVTNCAVCATFERHDASEIVPYLCALDDPMSAALGLGLRRSGTRALGASCCDFRYQAGGEPMTLRSRHSLRIVGSQPERSEPPASR